LAKSSGQKFIGRNRAPRVQIEYDVEVYGAEKTVQLPFVMGVMADLSGKPVDKLEPVANRKFLEIDVDNFDSRLKAMKPRVAFPVANTLTGEGNLSVDITFESMDDFSPAAIARKVEPLRKLLETRTQLANLLTYMDGKTGAEEMITGLLQDTTKLQSLVSAPNPQAKKSASAEAAGAVAAAAVTAAAVSAPAEPENELDSLLDDSDDDDKPSSDGSDDDDLDSLLNGL
jgi:type VI secretion system protein ImpB